MGDWEGTGVDEDQCWSGQGKGLSAEARSAIDNGRWREA